MVTAHRDVQKREKGGLAFSLKENRKPVELKGKPVEGGKTSFENSSQRSRINV